MGALKLVGLERFASPATNNEVISKGGRVIPPTEALFEYLRDMEVQDMRGNAVKVFEVIEAETVEEEVETVEEEADGSADEEADEADKGTEVAPAKRAARAPRTAK